MDFCRWSLYIFLIRKCLLICFIINNRLYGGMKFDLMDFCRWSFLRRKMWWKCYWLRRWCCMMMWRLNLIWWVDEIWGRGGILNIGWIFLDLKIEIFLFYIIRYMGVLLFLIMVNMYDLFLFFVIWLYVVYRLWYEILMGIL